ncbi:MAG: energy transducer TonB [Acidobacteriota bacterium]|jgi:TonB family protein
MRQSIRRTLLLVALMTAVVGFTPTARAAADGLLTGYTLYVGHPDKNVEPSGTVLIVPGTLLPDLPGGEELGKQLKQAYRLKGLERQDDYMKRMPVGDDLEMPSPAPGMDIHMTLVGFNDEVATYRVEIAQDGTRIADTPVSVKRGGRAVIGSQDGEAAPYVFVVLRPEAAGKEPDASKPRILERVNPRYPELARKNRISGGVVLQVKVLEDGSCQVLKVVGSPDDLLSEAARKAVEQWKYEPGRDAAGKPVATILTLTVSFQLK